MRATSGTRESSASRNVRPLVAAACILLLGTNDSDLHSALRNAAAAYFAQLSAIAPIAGRDTTFDYYQRLLDDAAALGDPDVPQGYPSDAWSQTIRRTARLDLSLAAQLLHGSYPPLASIRGLGETLLRSSKDGTMEPVAVYVPEGYSPNRPAPLVVLLHGRPQSETQLLAPPYFAQLAEQTGTILIAPWGRGYYNFRGSASDVYDALHAAVGAFAIDPRQKFLAGYSMGGFSVFEVATVHPNEWSAVMCIAGALLGSDSQRVVAMLRTTPFYVLTGTADASIPTQYPAATAAYLHAAGLDVSFYSEPGGIHRLISLLPILSQAWNDMLHQIVRAPPDGLGALKLPTSIPMNAMKP